MAKISLILLLLSAMLTAGTCQTFQYSRGWTNGKRAENPSLGPAGFQSKFKLANFPAQVFNGHSSDIVASPSLSTHCGLEKLKMILQGNGNEQLYLLPCELLVDLQKSYQNQQQQQQQQQDMLPAVGHYRRASSTAFDINNNNY